MSSRSRYRVRPAWDNPRPVKPCENCRKRAGEKHHPETGQLLCLRCYDPRPKSIRGQAHPGRNTPCTCGSGKKFKNCCREKMMPKPIDMMQAIVDDMRGMLQQTAVDLGVEVYDGTREAATIEKRVAQDPTLTVVNTPSNTTASGP